MSRDGAGDVVECEMAGFLGHARMEHDLEQQIAEFVAQVCHVVALDRVGDFVGFLDRVRRDGREVLRDDPIRNRVSGSRKRAMIERRRSIVRTWLSRTY